MCPAAAADLSLHVFVELHRFLQTGQPSPQVRLVRHFALVLHDLVPGFRHDVLDLSKRKRKQREGAHSFVVAACLTSCCHMSYEGI